MNDEALLSISKERMEELIEQTYVTAEGRLVLTGPVEPRMISKLLRFRGGSAGNSADLKDSDFDVVWQPPPRQWVERLLHKELPGVLDRKRKNRELTHQQVMINYGVTRGPRVYRSEDGTYLTVLDGYPSEYMGEIFHEDDDKCIDEVPGQDLRVLTYPVMLCPDCERWYTVGTTNCLSVHCPSVVENEGPTDGVGVSLITEKLIPYWDTWTNPTANYPEMDTIRKARCKDLNNPTRRTIIRNQFGHIPDAKGKGRGKSSSRPSSRGRTSAEGWWNNDQNRGDWRDNGQWNGQDKSSWARSGWTDYKS